MYLEDVRLQLRMLDVRPSLGNLRSFLHPNAECIGSDKSVVPKFVYKQSIARVSVSAKQFIADTMQDLQSINW